MDHWKAAKRVIGYLHRTNNYMLNYRKSEPLDIIGYSDSDVLG